MNSGRIQGRDSRDFLLYREGSGGTVEIFDIVVGSERRVGIGKKMVYHLLETKVGPEVKLVWAITRASNFIAQHFYEGLHFRVVGVLRSFYKDEGRIVDAIMYGLDVNPRNEA